MTQNFKCPVCGYAGLGESPYAGNGEGSYEICSSCGFEFGVSDDDRGFSHATWRQRWILQGMPWAAAGIEAEPVGWDPAEQVRRVGGEAGDDRGDYQ